MIDKQKVIELRQQGHTIRVVASLCDCDMSTVERILQAAGMAGKVRGPYRGYGDIDDKETRERWAKALGF